MILAISIIGTFILIVVALIYFPPRIFRLLASFIRCWRNGHLSIVNFADKPVEISYKWDGGNTWQTFTRRGYRETEKIDLL